ASAGGAATTVALSCSGWLVPPSAVAGPAAWGASSPVAPQPVSSPAASTAPTNSRAGLRAEPAKAAVIMPSIVPQVLGCAALGGGQGIIGVMTKHRKQREQLLFSAEAREIAREVITEAAEGEVRSEEHTSELQSRFDLVCRLLL